MLKKYRQDMIPSRQQKPPPTIITPEGDIEWEVHDILDLWFIGRWKQLQYLVSWEFGYGPEQNSWELAANLKNALDLVKKFHQLHPLAVGPTSYKL